MDRHFVRSKATLEIVFPNGGFQMGDDHPMANTQIVDDVFRKQGLVSSSQRVHKHNVMGIAVTNLVSHMYSKQSVHTDFTVLAAGMPKPLDHCSNELAVDRPQLLK